MHGGRCVTMMVMILYCFLVLQMVCGAPIFVAPRENCSESATGTKTQPLCSISAAIAKARAANGTKEVVLRTGTYSLQSPVRLSTGDSGLILRAADGERVQVSGGVAVTGWQESATKGIWSAPVPQACGCRSGRCGPSSCMAKSSPRQLYVDGRRANRTTANASLLLGEMGYGENTSLPAQTPTSATADGKHYYYVVAKPALRGWGATGVATTDMEFVYTAQIEPWTEPRCGIQEISADGLTLSMQRCLGWLRPKPGCGGWPSAVNKSLCPRRWYMAGLPGFLENAFELLTPKEHGQFYIARSNATIYYVPNLGEDLRKASVVLPLLESLLLSDGATNLTIRGIDFVHTAWGGSDRPTGYVPRQAGWSYRPASEAHSLGPIVAAKTVAVDDRFVLGVGGALTYLDSRNGPAYMTSQAGTATLSLGGDASLCCNVYSQRNCSHGGCIKQRFCVGGTSVCPCRPDCKGTDKRPPLCNASSPKGYRLQFWNNSSLCIRDMTTGVDQWCASTPKLSMKTSAVHHLGEYHLMLADDGSICIHAGAFGANSSRATIWCELPPWNRGPHGFWREPDRTLTRVPAGVQLKRTVNTVIEQCTFAHMGGAGLDVYAASQHSRVSGCFVHDVSGSGIQIGSVDPCPACPTKRPCGVGSHTTATRAHVPVSGTPCPTVLPSPKLDVNLTLVDNVIADVGREFSGSLGLWGGFLRQAQVVHNEVCRVPYGGISLGWFSQSWQSTYQRENTISYNYISHWMGVLADSGATYTLGPHINSSLHHNYASHAGEAGLARAGPTGHSGSGIEPVDPPHMRNHGGAYYPDDGSAFWKIHHNVAEDLHGGEWLFAWNPRDEHNLTVDSNFVDTDVYMCSSTTCSVTGTVVVNRTRQPPEPWPAAATAIMSSAGARPGRAHPDAAHVCKPTGYS